MAQEKRELEFRVDNEGRKIFRAEMRVDSERRNAPGGCTPPNAGSEPGGAGQGRPPASHQGSEPGTDPGEQSTPDGRIVRVLFRLISARRTWPTMGWLGPQLVNYAHNDAAALRQVPGIINNRPRPVPLMWNHSFDIKDKAGRLQNAFWEDSVDIPIGANGYVVVNRDYDERAAVGLLTGELDATSISLYPELMMSHEDMDFDTFTDLAGNPDKPVEVDGKTVEWLPVNMLEVYHHALVWAGADPDSGPRRTTANQGQPTAAAVRGNKPEEEHPWLINF